METAVKKQETARAQSSEAQNLRDLFEDGLKDIYSAEKLAGKTLTKRLKSASSPELVSALKNHQEEINEQVARLEQVFKATGIKLGEKKCAAMEGILKESDENIKDTKVGKVRDAGIIASVQKVKHYEIATYGTLHAYAKTLGENKAANLLAMTLEEEKKTDAALSGIAMTAVNAEAASKKIR